MTDRNTSSTRRHFLGLTAAAAARLSTATAATGSILLPSIALAKRKKDKKGGPLCFLTGTRIEAPTGLRPIETLRVGDLVTTAKGEIKPIRWIGRRVYKRTGSSWQADIVPVKIAAHAIAAGVPNRDLFVSPGHAMLIDGMLIRAVYLVNGTSISRACPTNTEIIEYFQILLDSHEAIVADGAPAETLLFEPGIHERFGNFQEFIKLYPKQMPPMTPLAPFVGYGGRQHLKALMRGIVGTHVLPMEPVERVYERILDRAG